MTKRIAVILAIIIGITCFGGAFSADEAYATGAVPEITAEAAILIDGNSGTILYTKNEKALLEPASTTKMITCLLGLENLEMNQIIIGDADTAFVDGSKIFFLEDERLTVEQVLNALMTVSGNDAAIAIAKAVAGSVEEFAPMMNARAKELGALNTNFVTPNGLHDEAHLTTAYDLAMIAKGCMENEDFRKLVSTYKYEIPATNKQDARVLYNTNRLLYDNVNMVQVNGVTRVCQYEGALGIKTGTTTEAGGCLVAAAERDGTYLIAVVLKSTDMGRYADAISILDYGFENYYGVQVADCETEEIGVAPVKRGSFRDVEIELQDSVYVTLPKEASKDVLRSELVLYEAARAPIVTGQALGVYNVYEGDRIVTSTAAIAVNAVDEGTFLSIFGIEDKTAHVIFWVSGILFTLIAVFAIYFTIQKKRRERKRRELREKRALEIARARAEREKDINKRDWRF